MLIKLAIKIIGLLVVLLLLLWIILARPAFTVSNKDPAILVDSQLLRQHVKILSVDYSPRTFLHLDNLNASAAYVKTQFEQIGLQVEEQGYLVKGRKYKNIIATIGPKTAEKLVVGAHYDVAGPFPGADDNASGVAGLIELARQLHQANQQRPFHKNITLVAYTLEEPPFYATSVMGSYIHAQREKGQGSDIELMICLEMIAYFSEDENSQSFPLKVLGLFYPNKGNFIGVIDQLFSPWGRRVKIGMAQHMSVPVYSINAPTWVTGVDFSDHRSYWAHGYDAVMVTNTSFYRNAAYHTANDTFERLNYQKMAEVVQGVTAYVIALAQGQ